MPHSSRTPQPLSRGRISVTQQPSRPLFTCTFCWHLSGDTPHVLGRSARLACGSCFAALIDLAICWVCGEVVLRGDECVSLGWCFWHRACYGCLLYGSRLICQGIETEELFREMAGDGQDEQDEMGRGKGREIDTVPLCANCLVEAEIDDLDEQSIQQKGWKQMDHVDGGLGRIRWEKQKLERLRLKMSPEPGQSVSRQTTQQSMRDSPRLMDGSTPPEGHECSMPLDSTIYVSMSNPLEEPAFKPSPTKPIPRWMQYLPEYRQTCLGDASRGQSRRSSAAFPGRMEHNAPRLRATSGVSTATICPTKTHNSVSTPPPLSPRTSSRSFASSPFDETDDLTCQPLDLRTTRQQPISWVSHEPLKRPSSRMAYKQAHERSETEASAYLTTPEFAADDGGEEGHLTQFGSSHIRARRTDGYRSRYRPQSPFATPSTADPSHRHEPLRPTVRTPPPLSSEYLKKYRPIRSPSPKPIAGFREPIAMIEAMRRDSIVTSSSTSRAREPESPTERKPTGRRRQETLQPSLIQDEVRARRQLRRVAAMASPIGAQGPVDGAESVHSAAQQASYSPGKRRHLQTELKKLFGK